MPNWNQILSEIQSTPGTHDAIRRRYLFDLHKLTERNVIAYYSGWLKRPEIRAGSINDDDKNGFMTAIHGMDRKLGLDLLLHTPGGDTAATESLVDYLRSSFGTDIRAIVPQLAMSGGTVMACACREVVMGKHSSLGPIDPQLLGWPAHGVLEEFARAKKEIKEDPSTLHAWQPIIAKYPPCLLGDCDKAIRWTTEMTKGLLQTGMFAGEEDGDKIDHIVDELGDHAITKSHARHLSAARCEEIGLKVLRLEDNQELQEAVLSVHHACMLTFSATHAVKMIENHMGIAHITQIPKKDRNS